MRLPFFTAVAAVAMCFSASVQAEPVTYTMDPGHTDVVVTWSHFGFSRPSAMFKDIEGTITYDPENPSQSSVEFSLPMTSVHTASEHLDEHLQNDDFFDVAKWPNAHFKSTKVVAGDAADQLKVTGDLTIHGVTKPITLDVTVNKVGERHDAQAAAFDVTAHLNRSDYGVGLYAPMVSDRIDIRATTEAYESKAWAKMNAPKDEDASKSEDKADSKAADKSE